MLLNLSWCSLEDVSRSYLKSSEVVFELLFEVLSKKSSNTLEEDMEKAQKTEYHYFQKKLYIFKNNNLWPINDNFQNNSGHFAEISLIDKMYPEKD